LSNYYEILGVHHGASIAEIKAAFRRLAKQYHPDRNPNGKEFFEQLLRAYETLSDPARKATYDYRLANNLPQRETSAKKTGTKTWLFSEQELRRRQYYNEHIRKYARATASYNAEAGSRKSYNEYKYILFAVPLAVALFLLIMRLTTPERKLSPVSAARDYVLADTNRPAPKQGDSPYSYLFGPANYDEAAKLQMEVRNHTGEEIVVCFFSDTVFIRSFFMESGFSAEVMQLPNRPLSLSYVSGREFDYLMKPAGADVQGGFSRNMRYYKSSEPVFAGNDNELTLLPGINPGFVEITSAEFFTKSKAQ
jgi:curved DNA-binding protein CbpA